MLLRQPSQLAQLAEALDLSRPVHQALWVTIRVVHVIVGLITLVFGRMYLTLVLNAGLAEALLPLAGLEFSWTVTFAAAILANVCAMAHMIEAGKTIRAHCTAMLRRVGPASSPLVRDRGFRWGDELRSLLGRAMALISIRGRHFDDFFLAREVITVALQSYLCHRLATSIVSPGTLDASIALLLFNCFSTPVIHVVGGRWHVLTRRLVCLVVDVAIDLTSSLIMPIAICLPYFHVFRQMTPTIQLGIGHDPIFVAKARDELGIAIANSAMTCATVYIPAFTLLFGLADVNSNPIMLPDTGNVSGFVLLAAQDTLIEAIPAWVFAASPLLIVGAHSPFCKDQLESRLQNKTNVTFGEREAMLFEFDVAEWRVLRGLI